MKKTALIIAISASLLSPFTLAKEFKLIQKTIPVENLKKVDIDVGVGSITYQSYVGEQVEINIEIEPGEKNSFFFSSKVDLSDIELDVDHRGELLELSIKEDDIKQTWRIRVPEHLAANIDLGVGEVSVKDFQNTLAVDVGVGDVNVKLASVNYRNIELETGVGDTEIRLSNQKIKNRSHLVGSSSSYFGEGMHTVNISVGVGAAEVKEQ